MLDAMLGQELRDAFRPAATPVPAAAPRARSERALELSGCTDEPF
jgi:hypothetical protein